MYRYSVNFPPVDTCHNPWYDSAEYTIVPGIGHWDPEISWSRPELDVEDSVIDSKDCDGSNCEDASISIKFVCVSMWKHNECSFVGITGYSTSAGHEEFDFASINWSRYYGIEDNSSDTAGFGTIISCVVYVLSLGLCLYLLNPRRGQQHILLNIWKEDLKRNRSKFTKLVRKLEEN